MLTTDYINHFGALAMLLEILPDFPEAMEDMRAWQPKSYEDHVRAITFTDPAPLLASYAALARDVREPFDATVTEANRYGMKLIALLDAPDLPERMKRDLCALGHVTMSAFIQRMNSVIAGVEGDAITAMPHDIQSHIDKLFA